MTTKLFTLLLAVAASVETILAWDYERVQIGDLYYDLDATTKTAEVAGYSSATGDFVIPSSVTYNSVPYSVTSIEDYVFFNCSGLTSVTIGNSVTSIGNSAFDSCCSLISVTIGNSVTSIGDYAFRLCTGLTSITIPDSVTSIGRFAFSDCTGLTSISVAMGNTVYDSRNNCNAIIETATNTLMYGCQKTIIPYSVTSIGDYAFSDCTGLTSVIIPNSVTSIGNSAFSGCSGLTSVIIPNSVTSIGNSAFSGCSGLTSVTIPNSVTSIGDWAFNGCTGLTSPVYNAHVFAYMPTSYSGAYTIPDGIESIAGTAFYGCSGLTSVTIGNSVTSIGERAFSYCRSLTSITIGNSVSSIGDYAFYYCTGLTSVTIPNSVTSIGSNAFYGCTSLTSVTCEATTPPSLLSNSLNKSIPLYVPAESIETYQTTNYWKTFTNILPIASPTIYCHLTVTSADETMGIVNQVSGSYEYGTEINLIATPQSNYKFSHWSDGNTETPRTIILTKDTVLTAIFDINQDLTSIKIGDLYYNLDATTKTAEVAGYSSATGDFVIPSSVTYNSVPYSVTSIGEGAFYWCWSLTSITIPNSVTSIGDAAFSDCSSLTSVTIGNSVISIGDRSFSGCTSLTSPVYNAHVFAYMPTSYSGAYKIPDGIKSIAGGAFSGCTSLTSVTIPNSVTSIEDEAFYGCRGLTSVIIPNSVTSIGESAFYGCRGLTTITISNSVTSIGHATFQECTGLTTITIPNSVTNIGSGAFLNCISLTSVTIPNSVTSIGDEAFYGCCDLTSVTIPNSVTSIGRSAFNYCTGLTSVTIPNSVTSIGREAFGMVPNIVYFGTASSSLWGARSMNGYVDVYLVYSDASKTTLLACSSAATGGITIPNSVTSIGKNAFYGCRGLTRITIPNSVTSIGESAFYGCSGLTSIDVTSDNPNYYSEDGVLFNKTKTELIQYPIGNVRTEYTIPNSVTSIGDFAFAWCRSLTSITIPNSVTSIGKCAFLSCTSLTSITCEATTPPTCVWVAFVDVPQSIPLYVPFGSEDAYQNATEWSYFTNIQPIKADNVDITTTEVVPDETSVNIAWPKISGAYTYELVIKDKSGKVVCTLVFDAEGRLLSIAFNAPARDNMPQQTHVAGFAFTVTGLNSGTTYNYSITSKDSNGNTLNTESGSFKTTGEGSGLQNVTDQLYETKFFRNGQLFIQRDGKTYSITGKEVR